MPANVPDTLREGGSGFPLAEQDHIKGGAWTVTAIGNWADEIAMRYRAPGMVITDRATRRQYILDDSLTGVTQPAADDRIDAVTQTALADNGDGTFTLTAPARALLSDRVAPWKGLSLPAFTLTL